MYIGIVCRYVKCYNLAKSQRVIVGDLYFIFPTDYSQGFGGKFGVQKDRQDKTAAGWDHIEKVEKHESQVDHSKVRLCASLEYGDFIQTFGKHLSWWELNIIEMMVIIEQPIYPI